MRWSESIVVDRPVDFTCSVDGDGRSTGSAIVFRDRKGVEQGRQRLTRVEPDRVEYRLRNCGPGGREMTPEVDYRLDDIDGTSTRVHLDFRAQAPLPPGLRQLAEAVLGRKVRALHVKDLELLKAHVEAAPASPATPAD